MTESSLRGARAAALVPWGWAAVLAVLLLGPALAPGFVLSYDMVWLPDLTLRRDFLGAGSALPRAVPSDAAVAAVDNLVPGMWLQKVVLVGSLMAVGAGSARLVEPLPLPARLVAVSVAIWNPFVIERLLMGHWTVLVGYAALPWLLHLGLRARESGRLPARLGPLIVLGSLSASTGLATAIVVLLSWRRRRGLGPLLLLLAAANAPWLVAGALRGGAATSDRVGAEVFAATGAGSMPGPLTFASLGGIWNVEVVLDSRTGPLAVAWLALLLLGAALGWRGWWSASAPSERIALLGCWGCGMGLALLSWAAPGLIGLLAAGVPGGGLLRDGSRWIALCVPLVAVLLAHAAAQSIRWVRERSGDAARGARAAAPTYAVCGALALAPIALLPDAALGAGGRLTAVALPAVYAPVRAAVGDAPPGDAAVLPFTSYRAPEWNGGRKVLDPLGKLLPRPTAIGSDLVVSGRRVSGEDPRADAVRAALAAGTASARADGLAALGVSVIVAEEVAGQPVPTIAGRVVLERDGFRVIEVAGDVAATTTPTPHVVALLLAWLAWLAAVASGGVRGVVRRRRADRA